MISLAEKRVCPLSFDERVGWEIPISFATWLIVQFRSAQNMRIFRLRLSLFKSILAISIWYCKIDRFNLFRRVYFVFVNEIFDNLDMKEIQTIEMTAAQTHLRNNVTTNMKVAMAITNVYQKDLAKVLGITQPTLSSKLAGKTTWTLDDIERASDFFHVKPEAFLVAGHGFEPWTSLNDDLAPKPCPLRDSNPRHAD